jgi:hypothetical protein
VLVGIVVLLTAGCGSSAPPPPNKPRLNIGLMPFEARSGVQPGEAESVGELFASGLQHPAGSRSSSASS